MTLEVQYIEGIECLSDSVGTTGILPGEMYMASRNTGWQLLECREVKDGCVFPVGVGYPYNTNECFKVK
jgi:hypothetical protein